MNHKRKRHPNARAGCKMCKPHKAVSGYKTKQHSELFHRGFGVIRADYHSMRDMRMN